MGSTKKRWKISFHRSSNALKPESKQPPKEFVCPIYGSLMADPVIVASGQTLERNCVQVCKNLGFNPVISDGSKPDFSTVIPNIAIKTTILNWCDTHGIERPKALEFGVAEKIVRTLMASQEENHLETKKVEEKLEESNGEEKLGVSDRELLKGVAENPPVMKFSHAVTELNRQPGHFYTSSEESVTTTIPITPLPFSTRPACYYSSSSSSEIETLTPNSSEEDEIVIKLKNSQVFEQEEAVISLRKLTRTKEEIRVPLCTPRLLSSLRPLLISRYTGVQINANAALVNLSLEKINKVKIVRSGIVPLLIEVLKGGFPESQEHAAGALFSLALDDENKTAIGVLGALPPLLHMLRSESERARNDSGLALYHLSLVQSNRSKLVKLGAIPMLLTMAKAGDLGSRALLILCNLASCVEGRAAMLDANAVECFVGMLRENATDSELTRDNCVAALYALSHGSLRFKGLAKEAGAVEVLREVAERGSERGREKAKIILQMLRGGGRNEREEEVEEVDWESVLNSGVVSLNRFRLGYGKNVTSPNSTEF
ncbi:Armadillo [Macleaya cordata]|uniref:RING-type E3 ubiquitin transferase n=1 Tax=Macleaya cordata TaxID=56857 RepID=A0A200QV64_MACCD|nr:Armadillo [Macleaya cordata]